MGDVIIALGATTPTPLKKYLQQQALRRLQLDVACDHANGLYQVALPRPLLEAQAELHRLEKALLPGKAQCRSETSFSVRDFAVASRHSFAETDKAVAFTPAERAFLTLDFLNRRLLCDKLWTAALVASGRSDAAEQPKQEWLVGPNEGWTGQPLLGALDALGYLAAEVSPLHGPAHHSSVGLPLCLREAKEWCMRALFTGELVRIASIRDYWGEHVAIAFAWQQHYRNMLSLPAVAGACVYALRPAHMSVDDDRNVPLYSLLAVVWAIAFVTSWRGKQAELSFQWGTADATRVDRLRPEFTGVKTVDAVTGLPILIDPPRSRAIRLALSAALTLASLALPIATMLASLNLQGYIVPSTGRWLGLQVHFASLSRFAAKGAIFDPTADDPSRSMAAKLLQLLPVVLHALTIQVLNAGFKSIAAKLTSLENHRTETAHAKSLLLKRFVFEATDCYLALFYIAFELKDVPKLRAELIALFTADTARRVLLETIVPMATNLKAVRAANAAATTNKPMAAPAEDAGDDYDASPPLAGSSASAASPPATAASTATVLAELALEPYDAFDDYLEMVLQFGYITLFASAFPLAPCIALLSNSVELIADACKLGFLCRRPIPCRAASIGGWSACCYALMLASVYTNLFIIGIASDQMAAIFPAYFAVPPQERAKGVLRALGDVLLLPFNAGGGGGGGGDDGVANEMDREMRAGKGRYVVMLMVAMEHALLLWLAICEAVLTRPPRWARLTMAQRDYEAQRQRATTST